MSFRISSLASKASNNLFRTGNTRYRVLSTGRRYFSDSQNKNFFSMSRIQKIGFFILAVSIFQASSIDASEPLQKSKKTEQAFSLQIKSKVHDVIKNADEIPGLKAEEFSSLKAEISKTWDKLVNDSILEITGTDKDVRPYFVTLQGILEHVLASELNKNIKSLKGFIHTPMPATPLCTKGEISKELVDPSIEMDPTRLFTVKVRTTIVRDYLFKGGHLFIVYPKDGLSKRTEEQQKIYKQELINYPEHLHDIPLPCESIPTEFIGATYLFEDNKGNAFVFSIKMTQAKDPQEIGNFGLWFGSLNQKPVQNRMKEISSYIEGFPNFSRK